jgi:hypothetical protein
VFVFAKASLQKARASDRKRSLGGAGAIPRETAISASLRNSSSSIIIPTVVLPMTSMAACTASSASPEGAAAAERAEAAANGDTLSATSCSPSTSRASQQTGYPGTRVPLFAVAPPTRPRDSEDNVPDFGTISDTIPDECLASNCPNTIRLRQIVLRLAIKQMLRDLVRLLSPGILCVLVQACVFFFGILVHRHRIGPAIRNSCVWQGLDSVFYATTNVQGAHSPHPRGDMPLTKRHSNRKRTYYEFLRPAMS